MSDPVISVVVPAHNEELLLPSCLEALEAQTLSEPYEVLGVNNASTDATAQVAAAHDVRLLWEPTKGYVHALRRGFEAARAPVITVTDADSIVPPGWLERILAHFRADPGLVALGGVFTVFDVPWPLALLLGVVSHLAYHPPGANMALLAEAYHRAGGWHPGVNLGSELHLTRRLRRLGRVAIDHRLVVRTSGRRFAARPLATAWTYLANDSSLLLRGRPLYLTFPDIRNGRIQPAGQGSAPRWPARFRLARGRRAG